MRSGEISYTPEQPSFNTVSELLLDADDGLAGLFVEARERLINGDRAGYELASRQQTEIVAGLSERVDDYRASGGQVSEVVALFVASHSNLARDTLEDGWDYPRVAFFPSGTDRNGPSTLRQLAESL